MSNLTTIPHDFLFQLTDEEWKNQRSQNVIFNKDTRKYKPYAGYCAWFIKYIYY